MQNFSKTTKRKISNFKFHYLKDATLIGTKEMPLLRKTDSVPTNVISFSEINRIVSKKDYYVDFVS